MKTRTNQPVFYDNGQKVDDNALGGTQLYKHTLRLSVEVGPDEYENQDIDIVSIRSTAYSSLSTIADENNYEVLSYGYVMVEAEPKQVIGFGFSGMENYLIYCLSGGSIAYVEVSGDFSDTVIPL